MIKLRKQHPAFRMTSAEQIAKHIKFDKVDTAKTPNLISYSIVDNANNDSWKEIKVVFNGSDKPYQVKVAKGNWIVIADDAQISADGLATSRGGMMTVAPCSALILAREK